MQRQTQGQDKLARGEIQDGSKIEDQDGTTIMQDDSQVNCLSFCFENGTNISHGVQRGGECLSHFSNHLGGKKGYSGWIHGVMKWDVEKKEF